MSQYIKVEENKDEILRKVAKEIRDGKNAIFPTETVYGIGANAFNENAVKKIYEKKNYKKYNRIRI